MGRILLIVCLLLAASGLAYHAFFYPPVLYQRSVEHRLNGLSDTVHTQDRAALKDAVALVLSDTSRVTLEMVQASLPGQETPKPVAQEFTKAEFLNFIDIVLYSVKNYRFDAYVQSFTFDSAEKTAKLHFNAHAQADDVTGMSVTGNMHFSTDSPCDAKVMFMAKEAPIFEAISCRVIVRYSLGSPDKR